MERNLELPVVLSEAEVRSVRQWLEIESRCCPKAKASSCCTISAGLATSTKAIWPWAGAR
ncbi:MAG: hypothetical protein RLZZ609_2497 [Cyanobacteriota bacterium]